MSPVTISPKEETVIRMFEGKLPQFITAHVLDMTVPQLSYRRRQLNLKAAKGKLSRHHFVWAFNCSPYRVLDDVYYRRLVSLRRTLLDEESWKLAGKSPSGDDLAPATAIYRYRALIPTMVFRELFELNEKAFTKIAKAIGKTYPPKLANKIARAFYASEEIPEMEDLSKTQMAEVEGIVKKLRQSAASREDKRIETHKRKLLSEMKRNNRKSKGEKVTCADGRCNTKWSRSADFFFRTTDSEDGLSNVCKYCTYCKKVELRQVERPIRRLARRRTLSDEETKVLVAKLSAISEAIPSLYIRELYSLTQRQLVRLRKLANCQRSPGAGQRHLLRMRLLRDEEFPKLDGLPPSEREKLLAIWRKDVANWRADTQRFDEGKLRGMRKRRDAMLSGSSGDGSLVKCEGQCNESFPFEHFFFPVKAGSYKFHCRYCINIRDRQGRKDVGLPE